MITGVGLVLIPGSRQARVGSSIKLIRPDKTVLEAVITSIAFETGDISVGRVLTKQDVPIGTEVWLIE